MQGYSRKEALGIVLGVGASAAFQWAIALSPATSLHLAPGTYEFGSPLTVMRYSIVVTGSGLLGPSTQVSGSQISVAAFLVNVALLALPLLSPLLWRGRGATLMLSASLGVLGGIVLAVPIGLLLGAIGIRSLGPVGDRTGELLYYLISAAMGSAVGVLIPISNHRRVEA